MARLWVSATLFSLLVISHVQAAESTIFNLKADPSSLTEQYVEAENPENLKGLKRVVIPSFMVDFVTEARAETLISGIGVLTGAPSNVMIRLSGADSARFQEITDRLYDRAVADLKKAGIEVVALERLKASDTYKELAAKGEKAPREEEAKGGKGMYYTAKELPLYYMDEVNFIPKFQIKLFGNKPKEDLFLTWGTKFGSGFSTAMVPQLEEKLAQEFEASVLKVRITVLGGQLEKDESFWNFSAQADIKAKAAGSFAPMVTRYAFIGGDGSKARLSLKQAVSTSELGELANVTSAASKAGDTARNAITAGSRLVAAFGGGPAINLGYGNTVDYEWRVKPGAFEKVVIDYYPGVSTLFTAKLKQITVGADTPEQVAQRD